MEICKLADSNKITYTSEQRKLYFVSVDKKLENIIAFPEVRLEPELFFHKSKNNIIQGQWKWSANCCHLLYDVLSDFFIARSLFGTRELIIKPCLPISSQILSLLDANIIPGEFPSDGLECVSDPEGLYGYCANPWRHGGHHHSYISNLIKSTLSLVQHKEDTKRNIIIYRELSWHSIYNRNIHEIEKFKEKLNSITGLFFEIVNLQDYDLAGQISLFANAERIISPHGSGLVWLNFCKPGTRCIEIFSRYFKGNNDLHPRYDFWVTANHVGMIYKALYVEDAIGKFDDPYELEMIVNAEHVASLL